MDEFIRINELLGFYLPLFTDRQKEILSLYYYDNLSLGEISENLSISRNAVYDCLKKAEKSLEEYEEKLKLSANYNKREALYAKLNAIGNKEINAIVEELRELED